MAKANLLDRAIAAVAPRAALRRVAARQAFDIATRGYDGAARGRLNGSWRTPNTSADAEIGASAQLLRDRMRDLVRNNPYAANALSVLVTHAVGAGIVPRSKDKAVNKLFAEWMKQNAEMKAVTKHLIFAYEKADRVRKVAAEHEKQRTGLEPVSPDDDPRIGRGKIAKFNDKAA